MDKGRGSEQGERDRTKGEGVDKGKESRKYKRGSIRYGEREEIWGDGGDKG